MTPTSTSRVLIRLLIHFAGWWAFWGWLWTRDYLTFSRLMDVLAAPVTLGVFYLRNGDWQWSKWLGVAGVLVSLALVVAAVLALRYKRCWAVWSAHSAVIAYWLVGCALIAEGA